MLGCFFFEFLLSTMLRTWSTTQAFSDTSLFMRCGSREAFTQISARRACGLTHKLLDAVTCLCVAVAVHSKKMFHGFPIL